MDAFTLYLSERAIEGGFIRQCDLAEIIKSDRLRVLLVRCGGRRFMSPAQDIASMIEAVEAAGDYVRDVSFPASDPIFRGNYVWRATPKVAAPTVAAAMGGNAGVYAQSCYAGRASGGSFYDDGPSDADPGL